MKTSRFSQSLKPAHPNLISGYVQCLTALTCLLAIMLTGLITRISSPDQAPVLVASMGASAVILFAIPSSPLAQPWALVGGHLVSAIIGVLAALYVPDRILAGALAVGLAVLFMLRLRCLHPPGAATALAPVVTAISSEHAGFNFLLTPLGLNVALMLVMAWLLNRVILKHDYPARTLQLPSQASSKQGHKVGNLVGIDQADIEQATSDFKQFIDISTDDLCQLFTRLQMIYFNKHGRVLTCQDIMQRNITTSEYATEVEIAWIQMHEQNLKVLPVLDSSRRVIGIVTRYDFLKNLRLTPHADFQDKWMAFIKRTPGPSTNKPEAIGHIMTRQVKTLRASAPISELIPLVVNEGHHHVPIIDEQDRFVGLVFQSSLIAALFNQQATRQSQ